MWKLCPADEAGRGQQYRLLVGTEYIVGRKNCGILIQDDQSISRSHAVLSVNHHQVNLSQPSSLSELTLKDTSKYGTFVNGEKLQNGNTMSLKTGDRITFGVFESKFRIEYEPLVVCSSCLNVSQKNVLNKNIHQLGGHVVNEWREDCTHLVMVSVKVTVKTICALICGRPVIKPEYFEELIKAIQAKQQLPLPERFFPLVDEPSIENEKIDLAKSLRRRTIFRGKTFMFLTTKQHAKLSSSIKLGGGETKLVTEETQDAAALIASNICVVEAGCTNSQPSVSALDKKWIDNITAVLQRNNYRTISEAEIGLAVIFASTERYCNPQTSLSGDMKTAVKGSEVPGESLCQSATTEEPAVPTSSDAYISDSEMDQIMDTLLMDENIRKETPVMDQRRRNQSLEITTVKETPARRSTVHIGEMLNRTPGGDYTSPAHSSSEISGHSRNRKRDSQQQLNSVENYFQVDSKKRERCEDGETPLSKHSKMEKSLQVPHQTTPVSILLGENITDYQKGQHTSNQKANDPYTDKGRPLITENKKLKETAIESILSEKPVSKKRKELEDFVEDEASLELVFANQELDSEEDKGVHDEENAQNTKKKMKLDNKEGISTNVEATRLTEKNKQPLPAENLKEEIKEQPAEPVQNDSNKSDKPVHGSSSLPSKLLLTEFKSLVVTQSRRVGCPVEADYGHQNNFKKFKKVAYPGAGRFPNIIGGSSLIPHHARRNSEMEEWLRQEMEEQSYQAKEESLADDLFRYNPRIKRR